MGTKKKIQTEGKIKLQIEKRYRQKERIKKKCQIERETIKYKQISEDTGKKDRKDIDIHNKKEKIKTTLPRERYRQRKVIHKSYKEKEE